MKCSECDETLTKQNQSKSDPSVCVQCFTKRFRRPADVEAEIRRLLG